MKPRQGCHLEPAIMNVAPASRIGKQKKNRTKRNP